MTIILGFIQLSYQIIINNNIPSYAMTRELDVPLQLRLMSS